MICSAGLWAKFDGQSRQNTAGKAVLQPRESGLEGGVWNMSRMNM
jgi:hypothetical protein